MRVHVRPTDSDDGLRVKQFVENAAISGFSGDVRDLERVDFTHGFTIVALDTATDEFVGMAQYIRNEDWSRMNVLTTPKYRGLGIADFLSVEILHAAENDVVPQYRAK